MVVFFLSLLKQYCQSAHREGAQYHAGQNMSPWTAQRGSVTCRVTWSGSCQLWWIPAPQMETPPESLHPTPPAPTLSYPAILQRDTPDTIIHTLRSVQSLSSRDLGFHSAGMQDSNQTKTNISKHNRSTNIIFNTFTLQHDGFIIHIYGVRKPVVQAESWRKLTLKCWGNYKKRVCASTHLKKQ